MRLQPASDEPKVSEGKRLREKLRQYGVRPRKRWGQNFLIRPMVAERIANAAQLSGDQVVVEIGPGTGALTGYLGSLARRVIAIERDRRLAALLRDEWGDWSRVQIHEADFLQTDLRALALEADADRLTVVGNLPYSITTPILTRIISYRDLLDTSLVLVQREYAHRLAAPANSADYGSISVYARYHLLLEPLFHVPPSAFWPKPEVESTLIRLHMRRTPPVQVPDEERFFTLVRAAFGQRRKSLGNSLAPAFDGDKDRALRVLRIASIPAGRRGETLEIEEFARLARAEQKLLGSE